MKETDMIWFCEKCQMSFEVGEECNSKTDPIEQAARELADNIGELSHGYIVMMPKVIDLIKAALTAQRKVTLGEATAIMLLAPDLQNARTRILFLTEEG